MQPSMPGPVVSPKMALRTTQLVALAIVAGTLVFTGVAIIVSLSGGTASPPPRVGGWNLFVVGPAGLLVLMIGPMLIMGWAQTKRAMAVWKARQDDDLAIAAVMEIYRNLTVMRLAMLEGAGLFASLGMLLTGDWLCLAVTGAALVGLAVVFPKTARLQRFLSAVTGRGDEIGSNEGER